MSSTQAKTINLKPIILALLPIFILSIFISAPTSATSSSKSLDVSATIKDALRLELSSTLLSIDLAPTSSGTFSTGDVDVTASTTNSTGYILYVTSSGLDHNGEYTTDLVHSSSDVGSENTIKTIPSAVMVSLDETTGAYDASAFPVDSWAYSSSKDTTNSSISIPFKPIPSHGTTSTIATSDGSIDSDETTVTVGSKVDTEIVSGTYSNKLTFTLLANAVPYTYTVNYDANASGDSSAVVPEPTVVTINDQRTYDITLSSTVPTRNGYTFTGYNSKADGTGTSYAPGDTLQLTYENPTTTLYAQWEVIDYTISTNGQDPSGGSLTVTVTATSDNPRGSSVYNIGDTVTVTASNIPSGYSFDYWSGTTPISFADSSANPTTFTMPAGNVTVTAHLKPNPYTLTVAPNGGTWNGSTANQTFTQDYGTSKSIDNPTAGPTYTISYNANGQGASYTGSPTSVQRPFSSWSLSGSGTFTSGNYTYGAGNGTLTAQYSTTSNSFTLPSISKSATGWTYTCKWAEGSASGTQYAGGTSRTITGNKTYYAVCSGSRNNYTATINLAGSGLSRSASSISVPYGSSNTVTITASSGYYISAASCTSGYSVSVTTGTSATGARTATITNNSTTSSGTCTFTGSANSPSAACGTTAGSTCTVNGVTYIRLKDGKVWTKSSQGAATWANASSKCPSGSSLPTKSNFDTLVSQYGSVGALYSATGWSGNYWSSTSYLSSSAYYLDVASSRAYVSSGSKTNSNYVVCIGS